MQKDEVRRYEAQRVYGLLQVSARFVPDSLFRGEQRSHCRSSVGVGEHEWSKELPLVGEGRGVGGVMSGTTSCGAGTAGWLGAGKAAFAIVVEKTRSWSCKIGGFSWRRSGCSFKSRPDAGPVFERDGISFRPSFDSGKRGARSHGEARFSSTCLC